MVARSRFALRLGEGDQALVLAGAGDRGGRAQQRGRALRRRRRSRREERAPAEVLGIARGHGRVVRGVLVARGALAQGRRRRRQGRRRRGRGRRRRGRGRTRGRRRRVRLRTDERVPDRVLVTIGASALVEVDGVVAVGAAVLQRAAGGHMAPSAGAVRVNGLHEGASGGEAQRRQHIVARRLALGRGVGRAADGAGLTHRREVVRIRWRDRGRRRRGRGRRRRGRRRRWARRWAWRRARRQLGRRREAVAQPASLALAGSRSARELVLAGVGVPLGKKARVVVVWPVRGQQLVGGF